MDFNIFQPKYLYQTIENLPNIFCAEGQSSEAVTAGDPLGSTPSGSDMEAASTASWGVVVKNQFIPIPTQVPKT